MEAPPLPCQVKTIGIDARFADTGTGLGRYTRELVTRLVNSRPDGVQFVSSLSADAARRVQFVLLVCDLSAPWLLRLPKENIQLSSFSFHHYSLAEQILLPILIKKNKVDVFWSPHFNVPYFCPVPFVVTIHDLILHRYPNQASWFKRLAYNFLFKHAVHNAQSIIAVSHFTESELTNVYGARLSQKTTVIPEGVPGVFHPYTTEEAALVLERYGISEPFFLYVGNAKEHKNLGLLLDAFEKLEDADASLVLVSGGKELERMTLPARTHVLHDVSDLDLAHLYALAKAFVTPSLYEGFGLPIVEAAACDCPIIAIKGSAVSEVAPKTAMLIDPTISALSHALRNPPVRSGATPQKSWDQVAQETLVVLLS